MKVKFARYSVCPCGFPILDEKIQIGTVYEIDYGRMMKGTLTCGGCRKIIPVSCVWVESREGGAPGFLPEQIFEPITDEEKPEGKNREKNKTDKQAGE